MVQMLWKASNLCDKRMCFKERFPYGLCDNCREKEEDSFSWQFFVYWEILLNRPGTQKGILWGLALAGTMKIFYNKTGVRGKGIP